MATRRWSPTRVVAVAREVLGGAGHRLHAHPRRLRGVDPVRGPGVGQRLHHPGEEGRRAAHDRHRRLEQRLVERDHEAGAAEQLEQLLLRPVGGARARRVAEHPAAHLGRHVGDEAVHGNAGVGLFELLRGGGGEDRGHRSRLAGDLLRHVVELGRLVAEHHHVGALGHLGVGAERLAAELVRQRLGPGLVDVGHEHGLADAPRKRGGHVARPDQPQLHPEGA